MGCGAFDFDTSTSMTSCVPSCTPSSASDDTSSVSSCVPSFRTCAAGRTPVTWYRYRLKVCSITFVQSPEISKARVPCSTTIFCAPGASGLMCVKLTLDSALRACLRCFAARVRLTLLDDALLGVLPPALLAPSSDDVVAACPGTWRKKRVWYFRWAWKHGKRRHVCEYIFWCSRSFTRWHPASSGHSGSESWLMLLPPPLLAERSDPVSPRSGRRENEPPGDTRAAAFGGAAIGDRGTGGGAEPVPWCFGEGGTPLAALAYCWAKVFPPKELLPGPCIGGGSPPCGAGDCICWGVPPPTLGERPGSPSGWFKVTFAYGL
mmetsp:Transcript_50579/g.156219  ORF Transcript_50579/g.156219 Transcript_50579/m.156219 type:complete len:320 (-) Transcript_50579:44-1003(-)